MQRQSFIQGALILMISGFFNRILGFILRIILVKEVGDEGLGLFQMVHPVFVTLLLINTAGFPTAISKLIPERLAKNNIQGAYRLLKVTLIFISSMSIFIIVSVFLTADFISSHIFNDSRTYIILLFITPAIIFCSLSSSLRGFFQGF